jgi:hypothetical protein
MRVVSRCLVGGGVCRAVRNLHLKFCIETLRRNFACGAHVTKGGLLCQSALINRASAGAPKRTVSVRA